MLLTLVPKYSLSIKYIFITPHLRPVRCWNYVFSARKFNHILPEFQHNYQYLQAIIKIINKSDPSRVEPNSQQRMN